MNPLVSTLPQPPGWRFMGLNPLRWIALGLGSGLSPVAPGTAGTLFAWASYLLLDHWLSPDAWVAVLAAGLCIGWWACTATARALAVADPGAIVWDEVIAFWLLLWSLMPMSWSGQLVAFALFRLFDAAKPGPVAWADRRFKGAPGVPPGWTQGFGIIVDDLMAALCAWWLIVMCQSLWHW